MEITSDKILFWLNNRWNVMLKGRHGVGKTAVILEAFRSEESGMAEDEWMYFSGATLDPWVDFIGVPKEVENPDRPGETCLDLVRPRAMANERLKALFIDEYNRSPKKIRNAIMELIQFKSINGKKYPNLKSVIVAVNPDEEEDDELIYDVEPTDPAQLDRFHIQVEFPYKPVRSYFIGKYGTDYTDAAINWWNGLTEEAKLQVSPRRLDYALEVFDSQGDLRDVLPESTNVQKLKKDLGATPAIEKMRRMFKNKEKEKAADWLADENNYDYVYKEVLKNESWLKFFGPLFPAEKISQLIATNKKMKKFSLNSYNEEPTIKSALIEIQKAGTNKSLSLEIERKFKKDEQEVVANLDSSPSFKDPKNVDVHYNDETSDSWSDDLKEIASMPIDSAYKKVSCYNELAEKMPKHMEEDEAIKALGVIETIVEDSHHKTLDRREPNIVAVVNNLMLNLKKHKCNFSEVSKSMMKTLTYCAGKDNFIINL